MISDEITAFLVDVAQQKKPATVEFYRSRSRWMREAFGGEEWAALTAQRVLAALNQANRWPDGRQKAPDTQRGNIIAWDQLQKWAIDTGRLAEPVTTKKIKKPGGRRREVLPTADDIKSILANASPGFARLYQVLLFCGARPGELCGATIADLDRKRKIITRKDHKTVGKTGRPRIIPLSEAAFALVLEAIGDRVVGPIFLGPHGHPWKVAQLSQAFRRLRQRLLIDRRVVLYSTRHHLATALCKAKGIGIAAAVLGHSGLQTIQRYVHLDPQALVDSVNELEAAKPVELPPAAEDPKTPPPSEKTPRRRAA